MANIIRNNNNNNPNNDNGGHMNDMHGVVGGGGVNSLRDVCNFIQQQQQMNPASLPPGACPYDHIIDMINGLNLQDDGIMMNHKIKSIETDFCNIVRDENMLCESMEYINDKALGDGETALKFALLFSSRNFDVLAMKETKVRSAMLKILETNFLNADTYRIQDKDRLYNSITLLGEYYHRVRLADNSPITILGESLLGLLIREISVLDPIDEKLAKLILSQVTLNGDIMRVKHKGELTQLLYHIRRNLIEQSTLISSVKALFLMTLDLYYSNFANLGNQLEQMYTKYLVPELYNETNNNDFDNQQQQQLQHHQLSQQPMFQLEVDQQNRSFENGDNSIVKLEVEVAANANDSYEVKPTTKKWSEQVCEDSFIENEFGEFHSCDRDINASSGVGGSIDIQDRLNSSTGTSSSTNYANDQENASRLDRRSHKPRNSPRPLRQNHNANESFSSSDYQQQQQLQQQLQQSVDEERDQSKPLPRWRAPRFNHDSSERGQHNQHRRFSASFDEDHQSVRSDGGSIRLYSINDRLKHSQEKIERSGVTNFNSIANSNWDRQSQHDDRSERSYISNYERGNYKQRGGRHYNNNRQTYDKPPRFQKNQQHQQNQQQQQQHQNQQNNIIHSDSWRRTRVNSQSSVHDDENSSYPSNGPESNSRSSSRARTLPRPGKSNMDESAGPSTAMPSSYIRSQSPAHKGGSGGQPYHQRNQNARPRNNYNTRYSSQSSLASDASSTFDRRQNQRNQQQRNYAGGRHPQQHPHNPQQEQEHQQVNWEETHSVHGQPEESTWDTKDNNSELVRNARQTTKYMNYLSSQK